MSSDSAMAYDVLALIEKYLAFLPDYALPERILSDKLVHIILYRFCEEFTKLTGHKPSFSQSENFDFSYQKRFGLSLMGCGDDSSYIYLDDWDMYFFDWKSGCDGLETVTKEYLKTFELDYLFGRGDICAENENDCYENHYMELIDTEFYDPDILANKDFKDNVIAMSEYMDDQPFEGTTLKNKFYPVMENYFTEHKDTLCEKDCKLFQQLIAIFDNLPASGDEGAWFVEKTTHAWYGITYYGMMDYYRSFSYYDLPCNKFLERLWADVCMIHLNNIYHFYDDKVRTLEY